MRKNRTFKRYALIAPLEVTDPAGLERLGEVVNINVGGMGLRLPRPLEAGRTYDVRVALPVEIQGATHVLVRAHCVWCEPAGTPDLYTAGTNLVDVTVDVAEIVEELVRRFAR